MTDRPLVSVLTPTWQRAELLSSCIENVRQQTYRPLEHVIVSDGSDPRITEIGWAARSGLEDGIHDVPLLAQQLGRNWSSYLPDSFAAAPLRVGMLLARGDYQAWLPDDDRMEPDHIETMVNALDAEDAHFAYGRVRMYRAGQNPEHGYEIGTIRPALGQITNVVYRTDLLKRGLYPFGDGMTSDWACIEHWLRTGARYAFVDRVTLTHRIDH
jgi:glycosyltransferase involved in cell wall biosynthesis